MTARLEDYALIGDRRSAALVCRDGSIDWLCWPRFDSDACFAALLGKAEHGRWLIAPTQGARAARRYQADTMVLETDFELDGGAVRVIDFMPLGQRHASLVRLVVGLRGQVDMRLEIDLRFDYGRVLPWTEPHESGFVARIGPDLLVLRAQVPVRHQQGGGRAAFTVASGQRLAFVLSYADSCGDMPAALDAEAALTATQQDWRAWIGRFDKPTQWPDAVRRSLLTLRALTDAHTGGLVAAPTTSLPEMPGGALNWDYRYCWLRDATFTIGALLNAGYHHEAQQWRDWMLRAVAGSPSELRILYRVDGGRHVNEWTPDWLPGYRWARPVRIGNAAAAQRQIDVLGELLDAMDLASRAGLHASEQERHVARALVERIEATWQEGGHGIWESRSEPRQYTYSKAMAWVGVDRFLRHVGAHGMPDEARRRLAALRDSIHAEVCAEGYHSGLGSFVQHYGGQELDASLLLLPLVGFLPADDPRIAGTIAAVERELMQDGLVRRKRAKGPEQEGAFLACTCWLADCRAMQGRKDEAREALERVLSVRNDVGLLSEEYDVIGRHLSGNFPQALSHLALVTSALGLSGPVLQRGGG